MRGKNAGLVFLAICMILAGLLLLKVIKIMVSAAIFAAALVLLGRLSRRFKK